MTKIKIHSTEELNAALSAGHGVDAIEVVQLAADSVAVRDQGVAEGKALGAIVERERISGIQALSMAGFERECSEAITKGTSVEAFAMTVMLAIRDRGITLDGIRNDAPKAAPHARPPADSHDNRYGVAKSAEQLVEHAEKSGRL